MCETHHCALSGDGALEFAKSKNVQICEPSELVSQHVKAKGRTRYKRYPDSVKHLCEGRPVEEFHDTVSAVAMDVNGNLACATSTGTCM